MTTVTKDMNIQDKNMRETMKKKLAKNMSKA